MDKWKRKWKEAEMWALKGVFQGKAWGREAFFNVVGNLLKSLFAFYNFWKENVIFLRL